MIGKGLNLDQAPPLDLPMRYFLTAPLFGMGAGLLLMVEGAILLESPWAPHTVALTHLLTLGVISMVMVGALYQIIPVVVGSPFLQVAPGKGVHAGLTLGVLLLEGGLLLGQRPWTWLAMGVLGGAFVIFLGQLALALARAPSHSVTSVSLIGAAVSLALVVGLGLLFVYQYAFGWLPLDRTALTGIHVIVAFGGWIGLLITGVGYAVIPMFYLSGGFSRIHPWLVLAFLVSGVASGIGVKAAGVRGGWALPPLVLLMVAACLFFTLVFFQLRSRKRRIVDTTLRFWRLGLFGAPLALAVLLLEPFFPLPRGLFLFGVIFLMGFALPIINGMLYKIVPFLVWLNRFSHLAGKVRVPFLNDIITPSQTLWQWRGYLLMAVLLMAGVVLGYDPLVRLAGLAMVISFGLLFRNILGAARMRPELPEAPPSDGARQDQEGESRLGDS